MTARAVRIDRKGNTLTVRALVPSRFNRYGFGTFLEGVEPGEISISQAAYDGVLACPYRSGLQGMEIFVGNVLAWGAPSKTLRVPLDSVSLHVGARPWFEACSVIEADAA